MAVIIKGIISGQEAILPAEISKSGIEIKRSGGKDGIMIDTGYQGVLILPEIYKYRMLMKVFKGKFGKLKIPGGVKVVTLLKFA